MKKTNGLIIGFILVFAFLCAAQSALAESPVYIGVLAKRGVEKAIQQWGPTADYLSERMNRDVRIIPLKFTEIEPALKNREIDFLLANSAYYARFEEKYGLKAVLTMNNRRGITALDRFGGVIFTRKNSNIKTLHDIKGKRFMCVKYSSFGGAHMAWRLLLKNGINPKKDCKAFLEGKTHDNVVMAVKNGSADVGTVRSDTLERMADEGKINMNDFTIINPVEMLERANRDLLELGIGKFSTLVMGLIDLDTSVLRYSIAGHLPQPILVTREGARYLQGEGTAVGIMEDASFEEYQVQLPDQFMLALFTDGILEILPPDNLVDKEKYFLELFSQSFDSPEHIVDKLGLDGVDSAPDDIAALFVGRGS